ncbi:hypothetical protein [Candidatus Phytoplasma sp. AldY-WA1]|uniref:hypothetical protein n=1 Tax=Candidatus Phytoplasma sp. AldY-WA1 TaxID=2852100 RepID=UPI00254E8D17|nr:hypothetical protein [Candidatus Phytoplasma sp. AldY-WA1]
MNSNGYFDYKNNKIEAVYFDDGVRVFTNCNNSDTLFKHANGAKNIYLFSFDNEKTIDLGVVDSMQYSTKEWIKNNIPGTITYNDENWGNCTVKFTDSNYNYTYTITCHLKQEISRTIDLGLVNTIQEMQTKTEEWIETHKEFNKHLMSYKFVNNDCNWGNCTVKFTDSNYNYTYTITCRVKETKYITKELCLDDNIAANTKEYINENVKGEIYYNDEKWGHCTVKSTDIYYNYVYTIIGVTGNNDNNSRPKNLLFLIDHFLISLS